MIWRSREPRYDVASGISQGARDYQEDAITADFPVGAEAGFVVLADGMGGHAAGDVASKIILTEVFSELKFHFADVEAFEARAPEILRSVADLANETLRQHTRSHPETDGMGATLVVPALVENRLWWISIGDSPLFLFRNGRLTQLNEDHSMAPQIDFMVKSGLMDPQVGANHPDRNCLISVLMGSRIPKIDCPTKPFELKAGDIVVCASDGLQFLTNAQIEKVLNKARKTRSTEIAERLLEEITRLDDPDQDNISFTVIKVNDASVRATQDRPKGPSTAVARPRRLTTVAPEHVRMPSPKAGPTPMSAAVAPPVTTAAPLPEAKVARAPRPVIEEVQESNQDQSVEDLSPVRLRPRRVTVIK
ncbi:protein phosphatase 2C domain-containing protein [Tabrizicola sp.]|uniref:protein phosphatase 2C domain-containing protein n=1 Tax=Tabrizicola sp. TaxID=2005166 RepID=UPI002736E5BE|nr:protein phosphatase 2C domain-containing protein [Tabrizicola sp.]MDP3197512.1 SpoIIE family protein phosphatase [Tabrizicola sp.]